MAGMGGSTSLCHRKAKRRCVEGNAQRISATEVARSRSTGLLFLLDQETP
jgi:hypothetical protein